MSEAVAVLAAGLKAPGGTTIEDLWSTLCAGRPTAQPFVDERLPPGAEMLACRVEGLEPATYLDPVELRRLDRSHHLAIGAAVDAVEALDGRAGQLPPPERCAVVCGVGLGATATYESQHAALLAGGIRALSPLTIPLVMPSALAALLSLRFGFRGPCLTVSTACASGATAIAEGVELLRRGGADLVLAGGAESMVTYNAMCSFLRLDVMSRNVTAPEVASRPFDRDRDGFVMGEGAGFVVLMRAKDCGMDEPAPLGYVVGHASNADAHHLVAPDPDGAGALRCMQIALADADVGPSDIGHVNAHGTSTRLNDRAEAAALATLFEHGTPPVTAVKGTTGHLIAGSGAVEAIVTLWSLRQEAVPPIAGLRTPDPELCLDLVCEGPRRIAGGRALSNSFGFGGANTCLVLADAPT